jgi:kinetochore protein Mis12/MTW1
MASRSDTELLTEHFGYPPVVCLGYFPPSIAWRQSHAKLIQSLLDEIINSVNFLAERALHSIEQGLLNAPAASLGFHRGPGKYSASAARRPNGSRAAGGAAVAAEEEAQDDPEKRHRDEVESGTHQLETLLWASIDKNFDRFEIYVLRNILCLKQQEMGWIRLGHYEGLDFSTGGDDEDRPSVDSVNRLRRRLQASQRLHCMLVAERARNAALLAEVRRLVGVPVAAGKNGVKDEVEGAGVAGEQQQQAGGQGPGHEAANKQQQQQPFRFLRDKGQLTEGDAETPLTTTTAFSLSQLQALRALSASLREVLPNLAAPGGDDDREATSAGEGDGEGGKNKKSWRRERLEYVETATRKHLEHVRGLELGENGEVRDGEWDGGGPHLAKGDVQSLEKVVTLLGGSGDEQDKMDES